ncbi:MAG: 50S ribosomal protein L25 [Nitrospinae bacterium]|nr:50S ribosomal protein L25 [Nitrospinota bacterium]MCY4382648.1 50S ribosomal protein L25 [Nitrospinota bacterium]
MENLSLSVNKRALKGKSGARAVRKAGNIPGVVYGIKDSTPLTISPKELEALLGTRAGANVIFQLNVEGEAASDRPVIVKELQRDPMKDTIVHADFLEIRMDEKIEIAVPLSLSGESPGEKMGGTVSQLLRELEVSCLPNAIPEQIEVDVSEVEIGDVIHVRDLLIPEGVELVADPDDPVMTVMVPVEEEEEEVEDEFDVEGEGEDAPDAEASDDEGDKAAESSD